MALTLPEALKRGRNVQLGMIAKAIVTTDELAAVIPIESVSDTGYSLGREGTLPSTEFIGDDGVATEESTGTDDVIKVPFRRIVGNMDIDALANDLAGPSSGAHTSLQIAKKAKATWRKVTSQMIVGGHVTSHTISPGAPASIGALSGFKYGPWLESSRRGPGSIKYTHAGTKWQFRAPGDVAYGPPVTVAADGVAVLRSWNESYYIVVSVTVATATADAEALITFNSSTKEFDGWNEIVDPAMVVDPVGANGDAFSLDMLDRLISNEKIRANRHFIAPSSIIEKFYGAYRALGGTDPRTVALPGYGSQVPTYRGIPILENDNIPDNVAVGTGVTGSLYLASLDADEGCFLAAAGGEALTPDADPRVRPVMGFRVETVGILEGKDAIRTRVKWIGAPVVKSKLALTKREGIVTA